MEDAQKMSDAVSFAVGAIGIPELKKKYSHKEALQIIRMGVEVAFAQGDHRTPIVRTGQGTSVVELFSENL